MSGESDSARAEGTAEDEIFLEHCTTANTATFRMPYRDLLGNNGNFDFSPQADEELAEEDVWSTIVNVGEANRKKKHAADHKHRPRGSKSGKKKDGQTHRAEKAK